MTVYVVEDDLFVCDAIAVLLREHGYDVVCHPRAEDLFEDAPPSGQDAVFVDLMLPGMSGKELINWLTRLKDPPRVIPISALSDQSIQRELRSTGLSAALRKPLDQAAILAALEPAH